MSTKGQKNEVFQQIMSTKVLGGHHSRWCGIFWKEEVGRLVLAYGLWIGLTVLIVMGLGRLKRWLLVLAENLGKGDCTVLISGNNANSKTSQGGGHEKNGGGLSGVSASADQ